MRRWKRLLCLALSLLGLAGCGSAAEPDQTDSAAPVIRILTIGDCTETALRRISEALSAVTLEKLGCSVELLTLNQTGYDALIDNLLPTSELADIVICSGRDVLEKLQEGNYIYRLDRFLEDYPTFTQAVPDRSAWAKTKASGYCYGIPFGNSGAYQWGFLMRQDICTSLGVNPAQIQSLAQLSPLLLSVKYTYPDLIPVVPDCGEMETFVDYTPLGRSVGVLDAAGQVVSVDAVEGFAQRCQLMHQWYQDGLILKNASASRVSRSEWLRSGMAFGSFARVGRYTQQELSYACGSGICFVPLGEPCSGSGADEMCFSVSAYTKDVDLCLAVLELLYSDDTLRTLCVYGEEGVDFQRTSDGAALPLTNTDPYYCWNWPLRDTLPQPWEVTAGLTAPASETADFIFDASQVSGELYQCNAVMEKYYNALCSGMLDPEQGIPQMRAELLAAQLDVLLAEKARQWALWQSLN